MPPFKDEQVLIIAPGSQTTETQLGLPESFTPPRWRFPTRMYPGQKDGEWEPVKIRIKTDSKSSRPPEPSSEPKTNGDHNHSTDVEMPDRPAEEGQIEETKKQDQEETRKEDQEESKKEDQEETIKEDQDETIKDGQEETNKQDQEEIKKQDQVETTTQDQEETTTQDHEEKTATASSPLPQPPQREQEEETAEAYEDDPFSTEGAVYPIQEGRVENWPCFFALLTHIYKIISPFHTPVLVVAQPCWSARDHELITQYFFENWKIPAFCLMDAALTACYAYGVPTAVVVDVGHEKCDVSAVTEFFVNDSRRGIAIPGCGGRAMTQRLHQLLEKDDFDEDKAEQLKKSPICEILPIGTELPQSSSNGEVLNPAAAASTGAMDSGSNAKDADGNRPGQAPRGPGLGTEVGEEGGNGDDEDNEGVLDVAAIVARDNAAELLAKRERERAERAAAKKGGASDAPKQIRLKNSERDKATFTYQEYLPPSITQNGNGTGPSRKRKRDIEVGVERFMATTPLEGQANGILDIIAESIHNTILGVPDIPQRSNLWDNLIVLGNGSRVKGFTTALLSILATRYTLSPSSATIFTSELPSNFTTPVATPGTNTPIPGQQSHGLHHPSTQGVNPLLVAATRNMMQPNQHLQVPGQPNPVDNNLHMSHRGFSQTPNSIKTVKIPEYFPEWRDPSVSGMEEAAFLGAQVAAKVIFIVDQGISKGFLTRSEYNDLGPSGIHECTM